MERLNQLGRQICNEGFPCKLPQKVVLSGQYVRLEPLNTEVHYRSLYDNFKQTEHLFDYLLEPELTTLDEFRERCLSKEAISYECTL